MHQKEGITKSVFIGAKQIEITKLVKNCSEKLVYIQQIGYLCLKIYGCTDIDKTNANKICAYSDTLMAQKNSLESQGLERSASCRIAQDRLLPEARTGLSGALPAVCLTAWQACLLGRKVRCCPEKESMHKKKGEQGAAGPERNPCLLSLVTCRPVLCLSTPGSAGRTCFPEGQRASG